MCVYVLGTGTNADAFGTQRVANNLLWAGDLQGETGLLLCFSSGQESSISVCLFPLPDLTMLLPWVRNSLCGGSLAA